VKDWFDCAVLEERMRRDHARDCGWDVDDNGDCTLSANLIARLSYRGEPAATAAAAVAWQQASKTIARRATLRSARKQL